MARFDRYMLGQLLTLFGFFSLILVLVYWINRAVRLFDRLIADGQSAWMFLELTSLSLPGLIRIVLPLSAFVAAVYVTNRMSAESELTVVQATGYSPFRLARPVLYFGAIVAV
ncbi:MAG: LptF/LptG family permease, partial [Octadecabacter sp.]